MQQIGIVIVVRISLQQTHWLDFFLHSRVSANQTGSSGRNHLAVHMQDWGSVALCEIYWTNAHPQCTHVNSVTSNPVVALWTHSHWNPSSEIWEVPMHWQDVLKQIFKPYWSLLGRKKQSRDSPGYRNLIHTSSGNVMLHFSLILSSSWFNELRTGKKH